MGLHSSPGSEKLSLSFKSVVTRNGKRLHNELERSTIFTGYNNYFYGNFQ